MTFDWPQITYCILVLIGLGIAIEQHKKPKTGHYNAWNHVIGVCIAFFLLYKGGFFGGSL